MTDKIGSSKFSKSFKKYKSRQLTPEINENEIPKCIGCGVELTGTLSRGNLCLQCKDQELYAKREKYLELLRKERKIRKLK